MAFLSGSSRAASWPQLALVAGLLVALSSWFYHDSIACYPLFNHAWAQADWLALALKFRAQGYHFFRPATFNLLTDEGVTAAGFPVPAYLAALLMGLANSPAPAIMRLVTLGFGLGGLLALFGLVRRASGSFLKGVAAALFALASPIYVFYQANFLPSVSAFGWVLVGYYCLYRALEASPAGHRRRWLAAGVGLLAGAAAMRTPFAVPLLASLGHLVLFRPRRTAAAFGWGWVLGCYGLAFGFIGSNFLYGEYLGRVYHGSMFLARPLPFTSLAEALRLTRTVVANWGDTLLSWPQWLALVLVVASVVAQYGRHLARWDWSGHALLLLGGSASYYGLMGQQFEAHDYYLIDTFLLPLVLLAAGSLVLVRLPATAARRWVVGLGGSLLLAAALWTARAVQQDRIRPVADDPGQLTERNFRGSARWLDSLGVPRTATLLVLDARSYNLPLLLADRRGWTVVSTGRPNLLAGLAQPADYIVTQNFSYETDVVYNYPLITERLRRVATNGHLTLWRLRPGPVRAAWQLAATLERPLGRYWRNVPSLGEGPACSGRTAAWLRGSATYGLTFSATVAELGIRGGERWLMSARQQAAPDAQAHLVCSLEPAAGGAPYWYHTMPCQPTPPGSWWTVGGAFRLASPQAATDVLKVYLMKGGPGAAALDDVEFQLVR